MTVITLVNVSLLAKHSPQVSFRKIMKPKAKKKHKNAHDFSACTS